MRSCLGAQIILKAFNHVSAGTRFREITYYRISNPAHTKIDRKYLQTSLFGPQHLTMLYLPPFSHLGLLLIVIVIPRRMRDQFSPPWQPSSSLLLKMMVVGEGGGCSTYN